jgi:hypothetical protein
MVRSATRAVWRRRHMHASVSQPHISAASHGSILDLLLPQLTDGTRVCLARQCCRSASNHQRDAIDDVEPTGPK